MNLTILTNEIQKIPQHLIDKLKEEVVSADKIILLGNGGSNVIASHIAIDYQKFFHKTAVSINDAGLMSMLVNDYGYENMYSSFLDIHKSKNTLVILISSSGSSLNIINALKYATQCSEFKIVSLSGFGLDNMLYTESKKIDNVVINYHVDSKSYGEVESVHQIFLHSII